MINKRLIQINSINDIYKIRHIRNEFDEIIINCHSLKYSGALRYALKYSLYASKIGGLIRIKDCPTTTLGYSRKIIDTWQVLYQCAQTFYDDCKEVSVNIKKSEYVYEKIVDRYKNNGITFGILFSGNENELDDLIKSVTSCINQDSSKNKEIIICGPSQFNIKKLPKFVTEKSKYLYYDQEDVTSRFLVNKKKKFIFENAKFNIVCINHARISYPKSFYIDIINHPIEFSTPRVVAYQNNIEFNYLGLSFVGSYDLSKKDTSISFQGELIDKDYLYYMKKRVPFIGGGLYLLNKNILTSSIFDTRIAWGEAEDINLSMRAYSEGFLIDLFPEIKCISSTTKYTFNNSFIRKILRRIAKFLIKYNIM